MTTYRRPVVTDDMPTCCEHTMRAACTGLIEFNGETDHVHLLVHHPPTLAISALVQRLNGRTAYAVRREYTGRRVRAHMRGHLRSPSHFAVSTVVNHQAIHRRPSTPTLNAGPRPTTDRMG